MTGLGSPLVVFSDHELCDGRQHEVHLVTDGTRAHAYAAGQDLPLICREGTKVTVSCRVPDAGDEECHGQAVFDLTDECWTTDPYALLTLTRHGEKVDQ